MTGPTGPEQGPGAGEPIRPPELEEMTREQLIERVRLLEERLDALEQGRGSGTPAEPAEEQPTRVQPAVAQRPGLHQSTTGEQAGKKDTRTRRILRYGAAVLAAAGIGAGFGVLMGGGFGDKGEQRATDSTSTPTTTHTTQAPAGQAPAAKTPEEKLQARINYADEAKTVAEAVDRANPTPGTVNEMIRQMTDGENVKIADHRHDAWGSLASRIKTSDVTASEAKLGMAMNAKANPAVADATANILNHKDPMTPNPMSHKEALESIVHDLTHTADSKIETVSGLENHGFDGNNIYSAGDSGKIRVVSFEIDGIREYFKVVCLNGQWRLVKTAPPVKAPQPQQPQGGGKKKAPQPKEQEKKQPQGGGKTGQTQKKETQCPTGYVPAPTGNKCVHSPAAGPPPEANQAPRPQPGTPGYVPGNAEEIDGTQHGDPTNLDPTPHGTEAPNGAPAGQSTEGQGGQPNQDYDSDTTTQGTTGGTSNSTTTEGSGQTSGAGIDPQAP